MITEIQILGLIIVCGVFAIGFISLGIYMIFHKSSMNHTQKPPSWLKNKK